MNALFYCKIYNSLDVIWHKTLTNRRNNHISDHLEYVTIIVRVWASQVMLVVKNPPAKAEDKRHGFDPCVRKIPWRRAWQPTPVFLPGESYGQRTLSGYSPRGLRVRQDWSDLGCMHALLLLLSPFSRVRLSVIPWAAGCQAPLSMGFSRQEYRSGLPCPSPGDPPDPGTDTGLPHCKRIFYHLSHQGSTT